MLIRRQKLYINLLINFFSLVCLSYTLLEVKCLYTSK